MPTSSRHVARAALVASPPEAPKERVAALDLGSNSFHLVMAWVERGVPHIYDRRREHVALARHLRDGEPFDRRARARALACFERFGALLSHLPPDKVRVVATDAFRRAADGPDLLARGRHLLGHPIEIVPGFEEARLVWRGVSALRPPGRGQARLVVDIGGGSTEVVVGRGWAMKEAHSTPMGCIRFTEAHFGRKLSRKRYERAVDAAMLALAPFAPRMRRGIELALGSSGTMRAMGEIAHACGLSPSEQIIPAEAVPKIVAAMLEHERVADVTLPGLSDERRPVLPGGLAIVDAVMRSFELPRIEVAEGALREGVLLEIVGRLHHEDVRDDTITAMAERHGVDRVHARVVRRTATALFREVATAWKIDWPDAERHLGWAADLHEIGLSVAHQGVARHGAYLVRHADAPGFSREGLDALAVLVQTHRGRLDRASFGPFSGRTRRMLSRLSALLRVAVSLHSNRADRRIAVQSDVDGDRLILRLPPAWLDRHPMARGELAVQAERLKRVGIVLQLATPR